MSKVYEFRKSVKVRLRSIKSIQDYLLVATIFDGRLVMRSDEWVVDGKSSLGILSLNLTKDIDLDIEAENEEIVNSFLEKIDRFIA